MIVDYNRARLFPRRYFGIGLGKSNSLAAEYGEAVTVMRAIKQAIGPDNIMNPGKIFPP